VSPTRFAIVTDSTCDLARDWLEGHDVAFVGQHVRMGAVELRDLVDVSSEDFYVRLALSKEDPLPFCPSAGEFMAVYEELAGAGFERVVSVHPSQGVSGTVGSARAAARSVKHDVRVDVIDTGLASAGLAIVVDALRDARDSGATADEGIARAQGVAAATCLCLVPRAPLSVRSGTLRRSAGILSRMLGTTPLVRLDARGLVEEARTADVADLTGRIARLMSRYAGQVGPLEYVEVNAGMPRNLRLVEKPLVTNEFDSRRAGILNASPSVVSTAGLGSVGIAFVPKAVHTPRLGE
jgi:DegV family protein with EDD domain